MVINVCQQKVPQFAMYTVIVDKFSGTVYIKVTGKDCTMNFHEHYNIYCILRIASLKNAHDVQHWNVNY